MIKKKVVEGKSNIIIYEPKSGIVSKDLPVFYNPLMKFNRDISVLLLNSIENKNMQIADPLAGSGIRAVRFLTELKKDKIKNISINDYDENSVKLIKENIGLNEENLNCEEIEVSQLDANQFLTESVGFDYIDIDPFGTPNPFLDSAIKRISRKGILAVTATDTSALSGTYPKAGMRKYWAEIIRQEHKHEAGVRILIRKCQLIAAQYDKALKPILSYSLDHYFRIFFKATKGKEKVDQIFKEHKYFHYCSNCASHKISNLNQEECCKKKMQLAGPLWIGQLYEKKLIKEMVKNVKEASSLKTDVNKIKENEKILNTFFEESKIETPFFYDIHSICKKHKLEIPKTNDLIERIENQKYKVSRTHFLKTALKTDMEFKDFIELIKEKK